MGDSSFLASWFKRRTMMMGMFVYCLEIFLLFIQDLIFQSCQWELPPEIVRELTKMMLSPSKLMKYEESYLKSSKQTKCNMTNGNNFTHSVTSQENIQVCQIKSDVFAQMSRRR